MMINIDVEAERKEIIRLQNMEPDEREVWMHWNNSLDLRRIASALETIAGVLTNDRRTT